MPRLFVQGPYDYTDLSVLTLPLREVASGVGSVSVDVEPGIYRVTARVPGAVDERFVTVPETGETRVTDLLLDMDSPAPLYGARTHLEYHESLTRAASATVDVRVPGKSHPGELFIVVRTDGIPGPALPDVRVQTAEGTQIARLDRPGEYSRLSKGLITLSIQLPPGTYQLTHEVTGQGRRGQAVYVAAGWQTQVFAPWDHDQAALPRALVSMVRLGLGFNPDNSEYNYINAALDGLAYGRVVLSDYEESSLLNAKFTDPILGLIGAYGYMLRGSVERSRLRVIIQNLLKLLPESPDAQVLARIACERYEIAINADLYSISSPPMFSLGAQWLIEQAAKDDWLIPASSWLARIILTRTSGSVWTRWDLDADPGRRARVLVRESFRSGSEITGKPEMIKLARATEVPLSVIMKSVKSQRLYAVLSRLWRSITPRTPGRHAPPQRGRIDA